MDDATLRAVINTRLQTTTANLANSVSEDRARALQFYRGDLFGNEVAGRSQVVSRDVQEAVDGIMPSLLKIFCSGDSVVEFLPTSETDEQQAAQATDYVNWIWSKQNPGYLTHYTWFKDALLSRIGIAKIYWDPTHRVSKESYRGLTDEELLMLSMDEGIEITSQDDYEDPKAPVGQPAETLHDVNVTITRDKGRVAVDCIPPEEFLFDYYAPRVDRARILAHRTQRTISDLREMGYDDDLLDQIPPGDALTTSPDRLARFDDQSGMLFQTDINDQDPSSREVWVTECYLRLDYDGDGYAEMRKVTVAGPLASVILDNEEVDDHPFAVITPEILPHRIEGQSIADKTMDIQQIKSTLTRQALDNLYLSNNPQWEVVENQVNLDDMLTSRPGGIKRVKSPGMIRAIETPFVADAAFKMVEYLDQVRELRTGMPKIGGEIDASVLNSGATGAQIANSTRLERVELIARTFAETGVKTAFRRVLALICRYQDSQTVIRLRGKFVPIDPREWKTEFDLDIKVGLGAGNKDQMLAHLLPIKQTQENILLQFGPQNPICGLNEYYNTLADLVKNAGLGDPSRYFTDPSQQPPFQPPPHPDAQKNQLAAQQMQMQMQMEQQKMQLQQQDMQMRQQLDQRKAAADMAVEQKRAELDAFLAQQKQAHDLELQKVRVAADIEIERQKQAAQQAQAAQEMQMREHEFRQQAAHTAQQHAMGLEQQAEAHKAKLAQTSEAGDDTPAYATGGVVGGREAPADDTTTKLLALVASQGEAQASAMQRAVASLHEAADGFARAVKRVTAPRRVVRDEHGRATGVETMETE